MQRRAIRGIIYALAVLGMAVLLSPRASATIIYSICSSGCTATSGSYATTQAQAPGLTYSSAISFTAANLNNGVYTDPSTGVVLTATTNGSNPDTLATISGSSFTQAVAGSGSGFLITLPAHTYAVSLDFGASRFFSGSLVVGGTDVFSTNYNFGGTSGFLSIVSDSSDLNGALTSIFVGALGPNPSLQLSDFQIGTLAPDTGDGGGGTDATPEPSTLILLGSGLLAAGLLRCRSRRVD